MKRTLSLLSGIVACSAIAWSSPVTDSTDPDLFQSVKFVRNQNPIFPAELNRTGISEGFASVAVGVSAEGELSDCLPVSYSHELFATSSIAALKDWEFEPAREAGEPRAVVFILTFRFKAGQNVVEMRVGDDIAARFNRMRVMGPAPSFTTCPLKELDQIPQPVSVVRPDYPEAFLGSLIEGNVTIEFYIDKNGNVRLPAVIDQNAMDFAVLAVEAIREWKFEPPMKDGKAVVTVARQQFKFAPSDEAHAAALLGSG